jgi:beta-fructofuranosidase
MHLLTEDYWEKIKEQQDDLRKKIVQDSWRLHYHQMPETGWLNDPNGACQFNGTYHLYHQYVPENPEGGVPHWAHKTSTDMVHFTEEEIFLSPDHSYEKDGVYSGSAFVKDNEIHYFYTGNVKNEGDHDYIFSGREQNTVHVVSKDGFSVDYQEVVIKHEDYPDKYTDHVRDPKVFEKNGMYYMAIGTRTKEHTGEIVLYRSKDLYEWEHHGVLLGHIEEMGYMWECPDFFELDGQSVLLFSPQGLLKKEHQFQNVYQTGYFIGETDWDKVAFEPKSTFKDLDYGFDFYAPQTFEDEQGRRILWGWMGIGDTKPEYTNPTTSRGWQHALTLPRQLTIENNELKQRPLPEYKKIRKEEKTFDIQLRGNYQHQELTCEVTELLINLENIEGPFEVQLRQDSLIRYDQGIFELRHGVSGSGRSVRSIEIKDLKQIQVFSDTSSLELFINDGSYVMSSRVYPKQGEDTVVFNGIADIQVQKWDLKKTSK